MPDLSPGANVALPDRALGVVLGGPFDLSALVLSASGAVSGDADMVFYNQPDAPGVRLRGQRIIVATGALRRGADRVVVVASPERAGEAVGALPPLLLIDARERPFARFQPPPMRTETVALLAEVYRRGGAWRVRAVGQGYADGLAGLARDYGVDVADDTSAAGRRAGPIPGRTEPGGRRAGARAGGPADDTAAGRAGQGPGRAGGRRATKGDPLGLAAVEARAGQGPARAGGRRATDADPLGEVVARTNAERAQCGLPALTVDARLAQAAHAHSADMVRRGFFDHQNPDGRQVWDRALAAGYGYRKVAENIAAGQRTADEVVRGWMDSPGHRANILDRDLTQIGVGRVEGGSYGIYWTQVFGAPR